MLDRRHKEIKLLRKKYGSLQHGENLEWILFKEFPYPTGWNRDESELLILVPQGYPATPPTGFCVTAGLRTASGASPSNYSEGASYLGKQWGQFSYRAETWNPSEDLLDGDNLLTFMIGVERRLKEVN